MKNVCPDCCGAGSIQLPELQGVDVRFPDEIECVLCGGTGRVYEYERLLTFWASRSDLFDRSVFQAGVPIED